MHKVLFLLSFFLFQCSNHGGPSASLGPKNVADGLVIHSGYLLTNIDGSSPVAQVFVSFDGQALSQALWIQNPLSLRLPIWKTASSHTITVQGYSIQGELMMNQKVTVRRGLNTDVNGDGYSDLVVGASGSDIAGSNRGIVYLYLGSKTGIPLAPSQTVLYPGSNNSTGFGGSLAMAGDVNGDSFADVIVGASGEDKVYIFYGTSSGLSSTPNQTLTYPDVDVSPSFGYSVSSAGDVNGDGFDDVIVGALNSDYTCSDCGVAYVFLGSSAGVSSTLHRRLTYPGSDGGLAVFGNSVSGGGDVNGDGYADVVVGAPMDDGGGSDRGSVYIYQGSTNGISNTVARTLSYPSTDDVALYGWSVSILGDYNKDGYSDVVVGAKSADVDLDAADDRGFVYVYMGAATGTSLTVSTSISYPNVEAAGFGKWVAHAGDVNGDGYADLAVGADQADLGSTGSGGVLVYYGTSTGLPTTPSLTLRYTGTDNYAEMGTCIGNIGDSNGDSFTDLGVGVESSDISGSNRGYAYLFNGSASGLSETVRTNLAYPGTDNNAAFGKGID